MTTAVRLGPASAVWRPRAVLVPLLLAGAALLLAAVDVGRGDYPIGVLDVVRILAGGGEQADRFVVVDLRLPRALTALLVGLALGAAGAVLQSVARNPLASPDVLGITQGAGVGAIALIVLAGGSLGAPPPSWVRRSPRCSAACSPPPPSTCSPGGTG